MNLLAISRQSEATTEDSQHIYQIENPTFMFNVVCNDVEAMLKFSLLLTLSQTVSWVGYFNNLWRFIRVDNVSPEKMCRQE